MDGFPTDAIGWISALLLGVIGAIRELKRRQGGTPGLEVNSRVPTTSLPAEPVVKEPTSELGEEGQTRLLLKLIRKLQMIEETLGEIHQATGDIQDRVAANQTSLRNLLKTIEEKEDDQGVE